jgi:hypothetical protein
MALITTNQLNLACHAPRKRGIQFPAAGDLDEAAPLMEAGGYWISHFRGR